MLFSLAHFPVGSQVCYNVYNMRSYGAFMKRYEWNEEKNKLLMEERGLSFEAIIVAIEEGRLLNILPHPGSKYKHQFIFVVDIEGYVVFVPFVEDEQKIFLKTAFHNRKATRDYLRDLHNEND